METVELRGITFVKAAVLAKKYKYTTDYIGQLCRAGKVEAELVGRAWFVNEKSIIDHKNERYNSTRLNEIVINKGLVSDRVPSSVSVRQEIRSVLSKTTRRSFSDNNLPVTYNFENKGATRKSIYHPDDGQLEPVLEHKSFLHTNLNNPEVIPQKIQKLKVTVGENPSRKLIFEDLPEIALRGDLTIESLDDAASFVETEPIFTKSVHFIQPDSLILNKVTSSASNSFSKRKLISQPIDNLSFVASAPQFTPESLYVKTVAIKPVPFIVVPVFVFFSLVFSAVFLGLISYLETDGFELSQSVKFSTASVIKSVKELPESY